MWILLLLLFVTPVQADNCTFNQAGDKTCCDGNVCMTYDAPATAKAKADAQAIVDAQIASDKAKADKQAALDDLDKQSIRALRAQIAKNCDPKDDDCKVLQAKETQAKALRGN